MDRKITVSKYFPKSNVVEVYIVHGSHTHYKVVIVMFVVVVNHPGLSSTSTTP